ncbi:bactofilin family protein [Pseudofulvibacter geojedonensis]|uniref:Polymer-forming cytoskeletal protein n=1 Tax=Pseudofulvibacter geojedonensis TaxID=1123758 RepID=A0ABW3I472_9FLAO
MFSENKKTKSTASNTNQQNRIAQGTKIVGDLVSEGGFRIEGEIEGNINTNGKVVIGTSGKVNGTLICSNADIEGKFSGTLKVSGILSLKSSANVQGDVEVGKLAVEPNATFNATCVMRGTVKELNGDSGQKQSEKTA